MYKVVTIIVFSMFAVHANSEDVKTKISPKEIECGLKEDASNGIDKLVELLKEGEPIDPKMLVNNEYFLSPCFQQKASHYTSSFTRLKDLAKAIDDLKIEEFNLVNRTNNINEKLGAERKKPAQKAEKPGTQEKKKAFVPQYTSSFQNFKKKAKLRSIKKFDGAYFANLELNGVPVTDVKEGDLLMGIKVVSIDFNSLVYMDLGASKRSSRLNISRK